jgi:antitoxin YefM
MRAPRGAASGAVSGATRGYTELVVWQVAMDLVEEVYALGCRLPPEERFALCMQLRRAVVSVFVITACELAGKPLISFCVAPRGKAAAAEPGCSVGAATTGMFEYSTPRKRNRTVWSRLPTSASSSGLTRRGVRRTGVLYGEKAMARETTYTHARENLASLCDDVAETREAVIIHRRGARDVALVAADELESLTETAHLLRSPKNAKRLITALQRTRGRRAKAQTVEKLRREFGLGKKT